MATPACAAPRKPVSLRLPATLARRVEDYAASRCIGKTEAYVHFLELGLESAQRGARVEQRLQEIQGLLREAGLAPGFLSTDAVLEAVAQTASEFPAVERAVLFGSFARGEQVPQSDVDVRLVLAEGSSFNLRDLSRFVKRLERATGREVDVVTARVLKNQELERAIEREGIRAYERKSH